MPNTATDFAEDYKQATLALRNALAEGLLAAGSDPMRPQDVSRELGVNRNLTWKVSKLIAAHDLPAAFPKVPGPGAIKILVRALESKGVGGDKLDALQSAAVNFERMVAHHAGDRAKLELMLDSRTSAPGTEPLELSRRLAFQGNSGIWGCHARVRVRAVWLAPSADDASMLDIAHISGLVDLVRFRPDAIWPLFQRTSFADDGSPLSQSSTDQVHFCDAKPDAGPPLLRHFSSPELPDVRIVHTPTGYDYSFGPGPVGNSGKLTLIYGSGTRRFATRYRDEHNEWAESFLNVNAPAEALLMDCFLHRDLVGEAELESKLLLGDSSANFLRNVIELPCPEPLRELGSGPPLTGTPLMPRHGELIAEVFGRMGWSASDFAGYRLEMKHPPTPSTALLRYRLPERPSS